MIVHNMRQARLRKLKKWLIGIPVVAACAIAFASLNFIYPSVQGIVHIATTCASVT